MMSATIRTTRIGVVVPSREATITGASARQLVDFAARAEAFGFDSVWTGDSLTARPRVEPLALLAAIAARTSSVSIGTAALTAALRNPVLAAHSIATVDQLSEGRLILAVGAGFPMPDTEAEFAAADVPYTGRVARMLEAVALWRQIWSAQGTHDDVLRSLPRPVQPGGPPLWLAGSGPRALERVGELFDGWLPYPPQPEDYADGLATVCHAAARAGREPASITGALYVTVVIDDDRGRAESRLDDYALAYYGFSGGVLGALQAVALGSAAECASQLANYVASGVTHIVARIGMLHADEGLADLADALLSGRVGEAHDDRATTS